MGVMMPVQKSKEELQRRIVQLEQELQKYRDQDHTILKENTLDIDCSYSKILSAIIQHSQDAITVRSINGRYIIANQIFCDNVGVSQQELIGRSARDVIPADLLEYSQKSDETVLCLKKPITMRWKIKGKEKDFEQVATKFPIFDDSENVVAIGNIATDISKQVHAELKLQESEELFRKSFYMTPDSVILTRVRDGMCIDVNEGFLKILGYTREEVIGKTSLELNIWKDPNARKSFVAELIEKGDAENTEMEFVKKNMETGFGLLSARILKVAGEDVIISLTRDITERKKMEEALRESENRFKDLAELLPEAIFETDENLNIIYINKRAAELLGISKEAPILFSGLDLFSKEDQIKIKENLNKMMEGEKLLPAEYQIIRIDGYSFPTLFNISIITKEGHFAGVRGAFFDLTEQKQAEQERKAVEKQLLQSQRLEAVGRLAGGVAHDLNNMLSPILGYGEILLLDLAPGDKRREAAQGIVNASQKARNIIHQLLAYSRKQTLEYHAVDLNLVLKNLYNLLRRTIREDIDLQLHMSANSQAVNADIGQLEQVIINLCVNAQDAMPNGGLLIIETDLVEIDQAYSEAHTGVKPGQYMLMSISDTGSGIDEKTLSQIFEPFFSTKGEQGTGLGLATVYGIVKQHGGNIWAYSELGVGTSFKTYLPVSESDQEIVIKEFEPIILQNGSETILIVEDDKNVLELVHSVLERFGYTLLLAQNGSEALSLIDQYNGTIDLLLTDVVMPEMNGRELFGKVAEKIQNIKVLYMSGYPDNIVAHHGILEKGVRLISKTIYDAKFIGKDS